jgi:anti-anti-sigma factor
MERGRMRDDWGSSQAAQLRVAASQEGAEAVITLEGELDHSTAKGFVACVLEVLDTKPSVDDVLAPRPKSVVVQARSLTFIDSSGLMALMRARDAATAAGMAFRIDQPSLALRRIAEISGLGDLLPAE